MTRLMLLLLLLASPAGADTLDVLTEARFGDWTALKMRNSRTGARLCAAETTLPGGRVLRVNYYSPANAFIELFPLPAATPGPVSVIFDSDNLDLRADARRESGALIVELTETRMVAAVVTVLSEARRLRLT